MTNSIEASNDQSIVTSDQQYHAKDHETDKGTKQQQQVAAPVTIASIIGEYGYYQLSLTLLTFVRFTCVAMMTNTGPLIAPAVDYWCEVPRDMINLVNKPDNMTMDAYLKDKCQVNMKGGATYDCGSWTYNRTEFGVTLTDSFDLVCENDWYRSAFQSIVSAGVVMSSVIWGSFSDVHGRSVAIRVCFVCSLISGLVSYFASSFLVYAVARAVCSFGDLGLVISLSTTIVESLGSKYRGAISILVYTGWALGVMIMPWLAEYFRDYRQLMLFTVICHVVTLPWILTIKESVRWSLVNNKILEAEEEMKRISKWNGKDDSESLHENQMKFDILKQKFIYSKTHIDDDEANQFNRKPVITQRSRGQMILSSCFGGLFKVKQLFGTRQIAVATMIMIWTSFTCEFLYMLFILINSDIGDDVKLNYLIGGIMEILASLISIVIISKVTRKVSLVSTLATISLLCFILAFVHQHPEGSILIMSATKLAVSTFSSLVFVTITEVFPTNLRQTGYGVCGTLGSFGAVVAPFIRTELTLVIGMTSVLIITSIIPLISASILPFTLRETKGIELSDDVDDMQESDESIEKGAAELRHKV